MIKITRSKFKLTGVSSDLNSAVEYILKYNHKCNVILLSNTKFTMAIAKSGRTLYPMLDDMAQLTGTSIKSVQSYSAIKNKLNRNNALFIKDEGCLCCGSDLYEAQALSMVIEKGSMAKIAASFIGGGKKIQTHEAFLMRLIYLFKYSRKSKRKE